MIQLTDNVWALQMRIEANGFTISKEFNALTYYFDKPSFESIRTKYLPEGQWEFICTSIGATEEQAAKIVKKENEGYVDYGNQHIQSWYGKAGPSLLSLLSSKGLEGNYALLRKL